MQFVPKLSDKELYQTATHVITTLIERKADIVVECETTNKQTTLGYASVVNELNTLKKIRQQLMLFSR